MFKKCIGYVKELELIGTVSNFDFVSNVITLIEGDNTKSDHNAEDVELLQEAFRLNDYSVYDKDVLGSINGKMYQVELHNNGSVQLHLVDENFEVTYSGEAFVPNAESILELEKIMDLQGNVYDLIAGLPKKPEFNIEVVKDCDTNTYYYACNNKSSEEIDLINVVFIGHHILKEEDYDRETLSYEEYQDAIVAGTIKAVNPSELLSYITNATNNGVTKRNEVEVETQDEDFADKCLDCGKDSERCSCFLW